MKTNEEFKDWCIEQVEKAVSDKILTEHNHSILLDYFSQVKEILDQIKDESINANTRIKYLVRAHEVMRYNFKIGKEFSLYISQDENKGLTLRYE